MRWSALLLIATLSGCYAIPSEHDIEPVSPADSGGEPTPDAEVDEVDASGDSDAGGEEMDGEVADGGMDATPEDDSGGDSDGGGSTDARADAEPPRPCGVCPSERPQCMVSTKTCVECLADDAGACQGQLCSNANTCIQCRSSQDCKDPAASVCHVGTGLCVPCEDGNDGQCSHITGKNVCSAGQCVQCTKDKRSVCRLASGAATACDNTNHVCTQFELGKTEICGACVSDAQCRMGSRCVQTIYQGTGPTPEIVGWHCQWEAGGAGGPAYCDSNIRPFIGIRKVGSIDAPSALRDACVLNATSCPAYASFSTNCGRYTRGNVSAIVENVGDSKIPAADRGTAALPYITPDDTACGGPGSKCVTKDQSTGAFRCTTRCGSSANDCVLPFMCVTGAPSYCSVN